MRVPEDVFVPLSISISVVIIMGCCILRHCFSAIRNRRNNRQMNDDALQLLFERHRIKNAVDGEANNFNFVVIEEHNARFIKEAWLSISDKMSTIFKKRYFCIFDAENQQLCYYNKKREILHCQGIIELKRLKKVIKIGNKLQIIIPDQTWFLSFGTRTEMEEWNDLFYEYCLYEDVVPNHLEGVDNHINERKKVVENGFVNNIAPIPFAYNYEYEECVSV